MTHLKRNYQALPRINSQMATNLEQSSLVKLSKELSSHTKFQQKQRGNKSINIVKKTGDVQAYNNSQLSNSFINEYRDELKKIRKVVEAKKIKQSLHIEDKLNRIQKLAMKQISQSVDTPRSLNYINLAPSPQIQQPVYSIYQPPPPLPLPYGYNPYLYPPNSYQNYHDGEQSYQKTRNRRRDRIRTEDGYERDRNYDQYDEGYEQTRYKKLKETNSRIIKRNNKNRANNYFLKKNVKKLIKRWRVAVWAIYFAYLLPRYSQKIMKVRSQMFKRFEKRKFNTEMTMMQKYLVKKCKPFFMYIANQKYTQFIIEQGQTNRMEEQKAIAVKKMINMIIQGLLQTKVNDLNEPATRPAEMMHMFCKHGAFPFSIYFTEEQLDLVTISEKNKYIRMDKNLEKSQLINFICSKILLYNTILQPSKVDGQVFSPKNQIINKNFYFIGSIWYQICLQVQDQYLSQVPPSYELANWRKLREKIQIRAAKSLSANGKEHEEEEIISGMLGKKKIEELFGSNFWRKQKNSLKIAIEHLHSIIVELHKQIKAKIKF